MPRQGGLPRLRTTIMEEERWWLWRRAYDSYQSYQQDRCHPSNSPCLKRKDNQVSINQSAQADRDAPIECKLLCLGAFPLPSLQCLHSLFRLLGFPTNK